MRLILKAVSYFLSKTSEFVLADGRNSRENSVQREKENSVYHQELIEVPAHPRKDDDKPPRQSEEDKAMLKEKLDRQIETLVQEYLGGLSSFEVKILHLFIFLLMQI